MKKSQFQTMWTSYLAMTFCLVAFNNCAERPFKKPLVPSESASPPRSTTSEPSDTSGDRPTTPPKITTQPVSLDVLEGDTAILSVATEPSTGVRYQWYKEGVAQPGATSNTFVIQSANESSTGAYWVKVSNSGGEATSAKATVTVQLHPNTPTSDVLLSSAIFNSQFYLDNHPDLRSAGINTPAGAQAHWLNHGFNEGRVGTPSFHAPTYLARYPDLQAAFGDNTRQAAEHFVVFGQAEGRQGH